MRLCLLLSFFPAGLMLGAFAVVGASVAVLFSPPPPNPWPGSRSTRRGRPGNVLFSASFDAGPGDAVLVCGAPSAGRSTLLHLLHLDLTAGGGSVQFQVAGGAWLSYHPTSTDRYQMQQVGGRGSRGA